MSKKTAKTTKTISRKRRVIRVGGESGQGINSIGEILAESCKDAGFHVFAYREYPSLIRGGVASYQVEFGGAPLSAPSRECDLLVCVSRRALHTYLTDVRPGGMVLHSVDHAAFSKEEESLIAEREITVEYINAARIAIEHSGRSLLANVVLLGVVWQLVGLARSIVEAVVVEVFGKKQELLQANKLCLKAGSELKLERLQPILFDFKPREAWQDSMIMTGNHAIGLGAIKAGVRAYYAYPMTPSSSILKFLADTYHQSGMLVKQAEDEITAAQMALGSMAMGTRAMTGTSGGGFDLMTETVSLAGMIEVPFVCVIAQRPGPATGLPTWTAAGDLNLAIYAAHGEFPRIVVAASDARSAYYLTQHALNWAEVYQTPVLLLTEKQVAESLFNLEAADFAREIPIERGLVAADEREALKPEDRYKLTKTGISPRWNPGDAVAEYDLNSDEHLPDGTLTEDAAPAQAMIDKRLRKLDAILKAVPEPVRFGATTASTTFIGWGSPKTAVLDAIAQGADCNYLHFDIVYPLKTKMLKKTWSEAKRTVIIEQNATGQFADLIAAKTQLVPDDRLLKYNGRPFFVEDIHEYLSQGGVS